MEIRYGDRSNDPRCCNRSKYVAFTQISHFEYRSFGRTLRRPAHAPTCAIEWYFEIVEFGQEPLSDCLEQSFLSGPAQKKRSNTVRAGERLKDLSFAVGQALLSKCVNIRFVYAPAIFHVNADRLAGCYGEQGLRSTMRQIELDAVVTAGIIDKGLSVWAWLDIDLCGIQIEITAEYAPNQKPAFAESLAIGLETKSRRTCALLVAHQRPCVF